MPGRYAQGHRPLGVGGKMADLTHIPSKRAGRVLIPDTPIDVMLNFLHPYGW